MAASFDPRIVAPSTVEFIRACQERSECHLGGGAALAGAHLHHRLSADIDLFVHDRERHRELVALLPDIGRATKTPITVVRDAGGFVRAKIEPVGGSLELDVVYDAVPDIEPPGAPVDGIVIESFSDLRANKLTCILSRSEPRDLVDLLFLDRSGWAPEKDLGLAAQKDGGIDPGILAWLLSQFPCAPLPKMLLPLDTDELRRFRDDLGERLRRLVVPGA